MKADRADVSWDSGKSKWLVRITSGEEVIRRYCDLPQSAGEDKLGAAARQTLVDEGYEAEGATIAIQKSQVA